MSQILVIEDEPSLGEFMVTMLQLEGYKVDLAKDGIEGLDLYYQELHDLVITDIVMPRKEGFEVCAELLKLEQTPEIIAMSAGHPEYLDSVSALGVKYTYEKPFDVEKFLRSVKTALNGKNQQLN